MTKFLSKMASFFYWIPVLYGTIVVYVGGTELVDGCLHGFRRLHQPYEGAPWYWQTFDFYRFDFFDFNYINLFLFAGSLLLYKNHKILSWLLIISLIFHMYDVELSKIIFNALAVN